MIIITTWITLTSALQKSLWSILTYNSHCREAVMLCYEDVSASNYGGGNGDSGRSGDRSKVIAAPITASVSWKQVIWHQRKNSSHHSFPPSTSHVTSFPHFLLLLWLLSSGSQLLPVNNFLEVARTGCSISDVTCPALHTLLSVHPMMPGRTDFSLSSIPDVLCDIGQIVVSLQSWVSSFEKKRIANNSIYTVGFWYILSEWMNEWIKSIIS